MHQEDVKYLHLTVIQRKGTAHQTFIAAKQSLTTGGMIKCLTGVNVSYGDIMYVSRYVCMASS